MIHAADGYARSTGKIGVCLVTSGPGATNLVTGIATANYDSVPLVCFTGQVSTNLIGNDAFQEVDIVGITKSISKYAIGSDEYPAKIELRSYKPNNIVHPGEIKKAIDVLKHAQKPVFLIGGGVNIAHAEKEMKQFAELTGVPVITTIMGKGAIPTSHPLYVGNIGIHGSYAANTAVSQCDVLFSIGTRFNDRITDKISEFAKNATIIHVDIDSASISRNIEADIPIVADAKKAISMMLEEAVTLDISNWTEEIVKWKQMYPLYMKHQGMTPEVIINKINKAFTNFIVVTDVGQNQLWTTQFLELDENKKMLTSGGLGTMGYGFPAALGVKMGNPDKDVIVISGDGGMQMNIQEMATAIVYEVPLIICIFNNGYLGNVRQWQEMFFDKRYPSTCLQYRKHCNKDCSNSNKCCPEYTLDFVKLAKSYGAIGIRVTRTEEIETAFRTAKESTTVPTVIEFIIRREENVLPIFPPGNSLSQMIME